MLCNGSTRWSHPLSSHLSRNFRKLKRRTPEDPSPLQKTGAWLREPWDLQHLSAYLQFGKISSTSSESKNWTKIFMNSSLIACAIALAVWRECSWLPINALHLRAQQGTRRDSTRGRFKEQTRLLTEYTSSLPSSFSLSLERAGDRSPWPGGIYYLRYNIRDGADFALYADQLQIRDHYVTKSCKAVVLEVLLR